MFVLNKIFVFSSIFVFSWNSFIYNTINLRTGGWYSDGWVKIQKAMGNTLPTADSYHYAKKSLRCIEDRAKTSDNALIAAAVDFPTIKKVSYNARDVGR